MNPLLPSVPTLAVSLIYCLWSTYQRVQAQTQNQRQHQLRERVAYMLWMAAQQID